MLRFLAALWVMVYHAGAVNGGGHAVSIFFVLSGYLIGGQLFREKRRSGTIRLREFYFKRITRIWLPYFVVLSGMTALFIARGQDSIPGFYERAFGALTYTYNFVNDLRGNIHPTWISFNQIWSLSVEEQFYLVVPLMFLWMPTRWQLPVSTFLAVVLLFAVPLYAGLAVGVFLATVLERGTVGVPFPRASILFGASAVLTSALLFAVAQNEIPESSWLVYLLCAVLVVLASRVSLPTRLHAALRNLGLMTYSYYLIHGLPGYFLGAAYRHATGSALTPVWMNIIFGLLALPLSYFFVRWIELPGLRGRDAMLKSKSGWIAWAPWIAWGLNLVGLVGLLYIAIRS